jgi:hypothetical protein
MSGYVIDAYDGEQPRWTVTFVEAYAILTTTVEATDEDDAVVLASNFIDDYYGIDLDGWKADAEQVAS